MCDVIMSFCSISYSKLISFHNEYPMKLNTMINVGFFFTRKVPPGDSVFLGSIGLPWIPLTVTLWMGCDIISSMSSALISAGGTCCEEIWEDCSICGEGSVCLLTWGEGGTWDPEGVVRDSCGDEDCLVTSGFDWIWSLRPACLWFGLSMSLKFA